MDEFISEDGLNTFEGWSRYQAINLSTLTEEQLATWRGFFDEARRRSEANPKVGLMKLQPVPGEFKYAVAVREGDGLWLVLWVRRSPKGEFFVMKPIGDREWDPHTSYHLNGNVHMKSHDRKVLPPRKRQPLTGVFRGCEPIFMYGGYAPKGVGAVCDLTVFTGVVEVAPGIFGPRDGTVAVDLVEPGHMPTDYTQSGEIVTQKVFLEVTPNVVITVLR